MTGRATFRLDTPRPTGRGALALVAIYGDIDGALAALAIKPVAVGQCRLRDLAGVDHGVVARWSAESATLMPHARSAAPFAADVVPATAFPRTARGGRPCTSRRPDDTP